MYSQAENSVRIGVFLLGVAGTFFISPWVPAVCIVLLSLRFRAWEAVLLGVITDLQWLPAGSLLDSPPWFTLGSIAIVWMLEPLRSEFLLG
jgi:hypothetical protein